MAINYSPKIVKDGLVLCLDAANPKSYPGSGTTWKDLSGNGNDGTLENGVGYSSDNNGSMVFDGGDDYCEVNNADTVSLTFPLTIMAWYFPRAPWPGGALGMVTKGPFSGDYDYMIYFTSSGTHWDFYKKNSAGVGGARAGFDTSYDHFNRWNHICYSVTAAGVVKGYENSILRSEDSYSDTDVRMSTNSLKIGRGWGTIFNGDISNVQLYNRALSESEIRQNFEALRGRYDI